jgi:hypothetical protein
LQSKANDKVERFQPLEVVADLVMLTLGFSYASNGFSLAGRKFADAVITKIGCYLDNDTNTIHETAVIDIEPLFENNTIETMLSTLSVEMLMWSDHRKVDSKKDLLSLIDEKLEYYGEHIAEYYGRDDWDDYIVTLLECGYILRKNKVDKFDIMMNFNVTIF